MTHYDLDQRAGSRSNLTQSKNNINRDSLPRTSQPLIRRHSSRPNLWQSRENLLKHDKEVRPEPNGASERPVSTERQQIPRPASEERHQNYENTPTNSNSRDREATPTNYNNRETTPTNYNINRVRPQQPQQRHPNDNVDATPIATRANPIGAAHNTPPTRYIATTRTPATYQLISAALNNQNGQQNSTAAVNQPDRRPVPAQRSNSVVANRAAAVNNNGILPNRQINGGMPNRPSAGPNQQQLPFNKYQPQQNTNNLLYSERRPLTHSGHQASLRESSRESHYGVYQSNASVNSARPPSQPQQNYINTPATQARRPLPTYEQAKEQKARAENPYMTHEQVSRPPVAKPQPNASNDKMQHMRMSKSTPENLRNGTADGLVVQTAGESCCSSSNPDSGYGGQSGDFYASHPSPQTAKQAGNEFDSWYNRRLQDAARKMNGYTGSRPPRTMTSDV